MRCDDADQRRALPARASIANSSARASAELSSLLMRATGWNNGAWRLSGAGYGIRISKADRDHFFQKAWPDVQIELSSGVTTTVLISKSFWTNCSELRSRDIGLWMIEVGLASWKTGTPHVLKLEPAGDRIFRLAR